MTADEYLRQVLAKHRVDTGPQSSAKRAAEQLAPTLREWAGAQLAGLHLSGSFAKGTAVRTGTDVDLFISLKSDTSGTLKALYENLLTYLERSAYIARPQNVSIRIDVGGINVDLVPGKLQAGHRTDHSIYNRRRDSWTKTNVSKHIRTVRDSGRIDEIRVSKIWRDLHRVDLPSFYLELTVITALKNRMLHSLSKNVLATLEYIETDLTTARVVDPANSANVVSDDLTTKGKAAIARIAGATRKVPQWTQVVW